MIPTDASCLGAYTKIRVALVDSDDLRRPPWRGSENPFAGHCYVASESLFHKLGGKAAGWVPHRVRFAGATHWWLENKALGIRLDATWDQYPPGVVVPYARGRGAGFLTKQPSRRSVELMRRAFRG